MKIGIDFGKGHLRMILSLYNPEDILQPPSKRVTRENGIGASGKLLKYKAYKIFFNIILCKCCFMHNAFIHYTVTCRNISLEEGRGVKKVDYL